MTRTQGTLESTVSCALSKGKSGQDGSQGGKDHMGLLDLASGGSGRFGIRNLFRLTHNQGGIYLF